MRGLTLLVAEASVARLRSALTLACAQAACGGRARIFLDAAAVPLLRLPIASADDAAHAAAGLPPLAALVDEAIALGVEITACQTGLQLAGLHADEIDARIVFGGVTGLLAALDDDRLVAV